LFYHVNGVIRRLVGPSSAILMHGFVLPDIRPHASLLAHNFQMVAYLS